MRITNFESTGLGKIESWLEKNNINSIDEATLKEVLKVVNIAFVAEKIDRVQSTLLCELKDSYVQQSQRYVTMDDNSYRLPLLSTEDNNKAIQLTKKAFALYERMSQLNEGQFVGRPKVENYKYGIPIEDARYILPLSTLTNLSIAMTGNKLFNLYSLFNNSKYIGLFKGMESQISSHLPKKLVELLTNFNIHSGTKSDLVESLYDEEFGKLSNTDNMILFSSFKDLDLKVGLGALTSTLKETPSERLEDWGNLASEKAKAVANRVLGYGHDSIAEQARTVFGMMCSMVTYHQQIRHRLSENVREDLLNLILDKERQVIVPLSIKNSVFYEEYLEVVQAIKEFRIYVLEKYDNARALPFLLNCDAVKLIISTNARVDRTMLSERICKNSQWEIRELAIKKLSELKSMSEVLYEKALPSCVYGKCKEGKMTCGKQVEMQQQFATKASV